MDAGGGQLDVDHPALDALRDVLAALSATAPRLVFHKTLARSDVDPNQLRLLIHYRPGGQENAGGTATDGNTLAAFMTADEKDSVHNDLRGMQVPAYDRHGRRFDMNLKMVPSNTSYRLFGREWGRFVADNQLAEAFSRNLEVEVELWAFRSVELLPPERRVEAGHHPDGALGMAILIRN